MTNTTLFRIGLVRFSASFLIILTTAIFNRILIADLKVTAAIVTFVLSFQHLSSPLALWSGHLSDSCPIGGRRRVPWIIIWTTLSAVLVPLMPFMALKMEKDTTWVVVGAITLGLFGFGLKAANLLVGALIVDQVEDVAERGNKLSVVWMMAIAGFVCSAIYFTLLLPVFDPTAPADYAWLERLCWITGVAVLVLTIVATWRIEEAEPPVGVADTSPSLNLAASWGKIMARPGAVVILGFLVLADFTFFLQEFVLEAFGGEVFQLPAKVTTSFNINFGAGMIVAMILGTSLGVLAVEFPTRRVLATACLLGAASFLGLALSAIAAAEYALLTTVFVLGVAKGLYNVGLSYLFMAWAQSGTAGVLMGVWGALGGFAVALGSLSGGVIQEVAETLVGSVGASYGVVFGLEVLGMLCAAWLILKTGLDADKESNPEALA